MNFHCLLKELDEILDSQRNFYLFCRRLITNTDPRIVRFVRGDRVDGSNFRLVEKFPKGETSPNTRKERRNIIRDRGQEKGELDLEIGDPDPETGDLGAGIEDRLEIAGDIGIIETGRGLEVILGVDLAIVGTVADTDRIDSALGLVPEVFLREARSELILRL